MVSTYQIFLADTLARIDAQIAHAQSFNIERGDNELLAIVANVVSELYDSRDRVESQLRDAASRLSNQFTMSRLEAGKLPR